MLEIYLPSGRTDVRILQVTADAMTGLYNAQKYKLPDLLVDTLQRFTNVSIRDMYLEDFRYMLAMFDRDSWPQSHRLYEWRCTLPFYVDMKGNRHYSRPTGRKFVEVPCNLLNTEEVMRHKVITSPWTNMPQGLKHPTVSRWIEAQSLAEDFNAQMANTAMYIDSDLTLRETLRYTAPDDLLEASYHQYVSCELETNHKCNRCLREHTYKTPVELLGYLRTFSDTSMMNMTLDLASAKNIYVPDDIPIKKLLYWHSAYVQDKQRAEEQRRLRNASRRSRG